MTESDEENYHLYGTLLEPYDEDTIPKKKAFSIEDQIATDDQGRRRFHGAFTGGFSAGFFNTVGSLEGWKPAEFKSSRSEKFSVKSQKPEDFMDAEDMSEFGIAPSVVRATSDYSNRVQRKRTMPNTEGSIPGVPVLQFLLQPAKETVGIKLLKKMGWRPGQGVGPRLTKSEKRRINFEHRQSSQRVYGCDIPEEFRQQFQQPQDDSSSDEEDDTDVTFAPDDYDPFIYKPKDNTFGMGYSGLDKRPVLSSHITLFDPPGFTMRDHKNNKVSISGQAFGVGAFENEDEDIYARDDMTKYDFELESLSAKKSKEKHKKTEPLPLEKILEGFTLGKNPVTVKKNFPAPILPKNFVPKHGVRISRFEPLPNDHKMFNYDRMKARGHRHDLSATQRSKIINSETVVVDSVTKTKEIISPAINTSQEKEKEEVKKSAAKITKDLPSTTSVGTFKPFITNPDKQKRYEEYLTLMKLGQEKNFGDCQPASMSEWEKEREKSEFAQAARMFKPVTGLVFDRFVVASGSDDTNPLKPVEKTIYQHGTNDMVEAAKQKMFGQLTRNIEIWTPNKLLCKRFNVPEPDISETEMALAKKKRNKFSVFDYYEAHQKNKIQKEGPELKTEPVVIEHEKSENKTITIDTDSDSIETPVSIDDKSANVDLAKKETNSTELNQNLVCKTAVTSLNRGSPIKETSETQKEPSNIEIIHQPISNETTSENKTTVTNESSVNIRKITEQSIRIKKPEPKQTFVLPTDPKEKKDLFKAIFLSSSESEDEKSDTETKNKEPEENEDDKLLKMKKILLEDTQNILEKPILKPSKGIFAGLDWSKINRNKPTNNALSSNEQNKNETNEPPLSVAVKTTEDVYGPKLPTINKEEITFKPVFSSKNRRRVTEGSSSSDHEWLEADKTSRPRNKNDCKKHKKNKSKHKKHKSKHKKKKHSSRH